MSNTVINVVLLDKGGEEIAEEQVNFPSTLLCNSDMMQKLDNYVIRRGDHIYTPHRIMGDFTCSFKERTVL